MLKTLAYSLMLASTIGLAACDSKSENKTQQAEKHAEKADDKAADAAQENAKAAKAQAEAREAKAEEDKTFVPTSPMPESSQPAPKN
jgi:thiamine biosynthesis lipoprotein ApbE